MFLGQVEMKDLTKYGSAAVARGQGLTFETTSSPVDPGDKGKVAEAVDVCFPSFPDEEEVRVRGHAFYSSVGVSVGLGRVRRKC